MNNALAKCCALSIADTRKRLLHDGANQRAIDIRVDIRANERSSVLSLGSPTLRY